MLRSFVALCDMNACRCDLFNKAYTHISDCIDRVYKDLTKGKAAPMGGVAYLSLEDNEVRHVRHPAARGCSCLV